MYMHMSHVLLHSFYSMVGIEGVVMTNDESESEAGRGSSVPSSYFLEYRSRIVTFGGHAMQAYSGVESTWHDSSTIRSSVFKPS